MIQIIRHHCVGRRRLGTALAFGLLAASAMSAHAGTVIVTGANGAPGALGKPGGAGASATATATSSDQSNSATAIGGNGGVGGPGGSGVYLSAPARRRRPRRRGQFDGDCVEHEGFSLSDGDLHGWERRTWGTTNRLYP